MTERSFSCEFFPPRTDKGWENLNSTLDEFQALSPDFISCTYGAGGSTQDGTSDTLKIIQSRNIAAAAHITCIGSTQEKIRSLLDEYKNIGVSRLVALRGDLPEDQNETGEFAYANELVAFIREHYGDAFHIEVAAYPEMHPQAVGYSEDLQHFKTKVDAGTDSAITQYFFNIDAYLRFVDDCEKLHIDIPIVPGIMPITNYVQLARFSDACGAEIPRWIRTRLQSYGEDLDSIREFGLDVVTALCEQLLSQNAPGLHFYSLNRSQPTATIWNNLGLR